MLHPRVEEVLHLGIPRIGEDAAIAERARTEFGATLKPSDDLTLRQHLGGFGADVLVRPVEGLSTTSHCSAAFRLVVAIASPEICCSMT